MATPGGYNPMAPGYPAQPKIRFDAIGEAWNLFTQQMGAWIGAVLIAIAVFIGIYIVGIVVVVGMMVGASGAGGNAGGAAAGLGMLLFLAIYVIMLIAICYLCAGMYRMALKQVRGQQISAGDVFAAGDTWLPVLGATLLVSIAVGIAYIFLVIPGLILGGLLMLTVPLVVDQRLGVMDAMQQSFNTLKSDWLMATLFYFVLCFLAGLGGVIFGIGIIFTLPLFFLGIAIVYRDFFLAQQVAPGMAPMPATGMTMPPPVEAPATPPMDMSYTPPPVQAEPAAPPIVTPIETLPPVETPPAEAAPVEATPVVEEPAPLSEETTPPTSEAPAKEPPAE